MTPPQIKYLENLIATAWLNDETATYVRVEALIQRGIVVSEKHINNQYVLIACKYFAKVEAGKQLPLNL